MTFKYTIEDKQGIIKAGFGAKIVAVDYLKKLGDSRYYLVEH